MAVVAPIFLCLVVGRSEESQRDSAAKPRVARRELPWVIDAPWHNPNGVAASKRKAIEDERCRAHPRSKGRRNPVGVVLVADVFPG